MISIVVPVYNAAPFVRRTIENLLSQDVEKELILVNDGSTDESLTILKQYQQQYPQTVKVIDLPNGGVSRARNVGIDNAKGEFLIFVDSDDLLESGTLPRAVSFFDNRVDCVFFSYKHVAADMRVISEIQYLPTGYYSSQAWTEDINRLINTHIVSRVGSCIYRTSILRDNHIRFNESMSHLEDVSFGFEHLSHVLRLYYINEPLYWYMHVNSHSLYLGYCHRLPQSVEYCLDCLTSLLSRLHPDFELTTACGDYVKNLFFGCIDNEALYDCVTYQEKENNLNTLVYSHYMSDMRRSVPLSVKHRLYVSLLFSHHYRLLLFLCGVVPRTREFFWNKVTVPVGQWVKKKILQRAD